MAIEQIWCLLEKTGGFGANLILGADLADHAATRESYEILAERMMLHFAGQLAPVKASYDHVIGAGSKCVDATLGAQLTASAVYEDERSPRTA